MKLLKPFVIRSPLFISQARNNVLNRTITISLLVRQQLERIDQILTHKVLCGTASSSFVPSCTTRILLGALHSYLPPHTAHHQLQCLFFLLFPCPAETHQMQSSKGKLLQCGQKYDKVTPPTPPTGAMILFKRSVLFSHFPAQ